jgi:UDP:flavonoid glycosyltransferase YjiC (YdhE family)
MNVRLAGPGRVLIVSWDGGGNAVPSYHLGQRLRAAGHDVHLVGWVDQAAAAVAAGLEFSAYPEIPPWPEGLAQDDALDQLFGYLTGESTARAITATIDRVRPDVLVIDGMMLAAYDAARQSGLPTVVLCHLLASLFCGPWGEMVMGRPVPELFGEVEQVLALTRRDFDDGPVPGVVSYVGPITRPDVDHSPAALAEAGLSGLLEPGDPWVLLSLSTTGQRQEEVLPHLLDGLAGVPARVLLTLGTGPVGLTVPCPGNVTVRGFVPHEQVLPHVSAFVTHAGLSSISTALAYGVPLVCVPQGRDQGFNAARAAARGVGLTSDVDDLGIAVRTVLGDPSYAAAARPFRDPHAGAEATRLVREVLGPLSA